MWTDIVTNTYCDPFHVSRTRRTSVAQRCQLERLVRAAEIESTAVWYRKKP